MIRETLDPASAEAFAGLSILINPFMIPPFFATRASAGAATNIVGYSTTETAPSWLMLTRANGSFTAYWSADGLTWNQVGSPVSITMASNVLVGLAVLSGNNSAIDTAAFSDITITGTAPDFYLVEEPMSRNVPNATASANYHTIRVQALNGFTGSVNLSIGGLPTGATSSLYSSSVSAGGFTNVLISLPAGLSPGAYPITVNGTSGTLSHSSVITLTATAAITGLPSPWVADDVGLGGIPGTSAIVNGTATIQGAGTAIDNNSETFHYTYQAVSG
jgi:hypothetical protein